MLTLKEILKDYIADDGLVRLDRYDRHTPIKERFPETVNNENGLLFRAEVLLQAKLNGLDIEPYRDGSLRAIKLCQDHYARTHRRPGQDTMLNSHDNKLGELLLFQLHGTTHGIFTWEKYLSSNKWNYNNVKPYKLSLRSWLLPRDQALFRAACGKPIGLVAFIHLWFSIYTKSKHKRMNRLRMESLKMSSLCFSRLDCFLAHARFRAWWKSWGGIGQFAKECGEYYKDSNQPYRILVEQAARDCSSQHSELPEKEEGHSAQRST